MRESIIRAAILAAAVAANAGAAFTGMNVVRINVQQGSENFYVFRVFAKFNNANDTVLNAYGMNALPSGIFWHNDTVSGPNGSTTVGTWNPASVTTLRAFTDSWVTIGGEISDPANTTTADPAWGVTGFTQAGIPANAGWFNTNPPNLQGRVDPNSLETLLAQFVFRNTITAFTTPITIGFNQGLGTPTQFATGTLVIPAPGAIALLGLAGLAVRRRRA